MSTFIARQPIFNEQSVAVAYELLYRNSSSASNAVIFDPDVATKNLLDAANKYFSISSLTNFLPAYINFTDNLINNDYTYTITHPGDAVIEILEDVNITDTFINKIRQLKKDGFTLALDDYTGLDYYDRLLPYVDIVKIDFMLTNQKSQKEIATRILNEYKHITLLAEKVETSEEFEYAKAYGYKMFQGYFFSKPKTVRNDISSLAASSYGLILKELHRNEAISFPAIARIIKRDPVLTFRVLQRVQTMEYYRGKTVTSLNEALVRLGEREIRRWLYILVMQQCNISHSDELVRIAYLRGIFAQALVNNCNMGKDGDNAFLLGIFSLFDKITGIPIAEIIEEIHIPDDIVDALTKKEENFYSKLLEFVEIYEMADNSRSLPDLGLNLNDDQIIKLYMDAVVEADAAYGQ